MNNQERMSMDKHSFILAALAPAKGGLHSPVQVQKLMFLLDEQVSKNVGGPFYNFEPYDYGPFDKMVYEDLEILFMEGLVEIISGNWRSYRLTEAGQSEGENFLNEIEDAPRKHIEELSSFVRNLSFTQLVSAIYKQYPHMKENSVFED